MDEQPIISSSNAFDPVYATTFAKMDQGFCLLEKVDAPVDQPVDFRYRLINPAFEKQTGLRNVVGKTIREVLPQVEESTLAIYKQVAVTGLPKQFQTYVAGLDIWIEADAFRISPDGFQIAVLFTNITDRKRAELNAALLDQISTDLSILTTPDQIMQTVGARIGEYMGIMACIFVDVDEDRGLVDVHYGWEVKGVPSLKKQTWTIAEYATEDFLRISRAGDAFLVYNTQTDPRVNGEGYAQLNIGSFLTVPFHWQGRWAAFLTLTHSEPRQWRTDEVELAQEVANRLFSRLERARAEEALREEHRRKDEFMAMLGHELRNPLAIISNTVIYLELTGGRDETMSYAKGISQMSRQVKHLGRMVDDLLDVSRIRQGKIRIQRQPIDLSEVVAQTVEAAGSLFQERARSLTLQLPPHPLWVNGDTPRLSQTLMNLLTNAAKYTDEGGHVWVSLEEKDNLAVLRVKDDGMGIPADELMAIFETFVQGDTSIDRPHGGLGLGLAVVKQIVAGHDGRIEAHSAGRGQGSEFVVELPLLTEAASVPLTPPVKPQMTVEAERVLLVDDNQELADMTAKILRLLGYQVETCYSGPDGIAAAEAHLPDVVLLDIGMPYLDGYEVCRRIRKQAWGRTLPVIALTGFGQEADKQRSWAAGFDGHLLKPIDYTSLSEILTKTIAAKKGH